jgi:hypothetical protein
MQASGQVLNVRPWDFKGQDGKPVYMLSVDLYDETVGTVVKIETRASGLVIEKKQEVQATISGFKPAKFGGGVTFAAKDIRPVNGANSNDSHWEPPMNNTVPAPQFGAPEQTKPGVKK